MITAMKRRHLISQHGVRALVTSLLLLLIVCHPARAAIHEELTGNAVSLPAYIIDSHETDGDATTLRNGLFTNVDVSISRDSFFDVDINSDYRVIYSLFDDAGNALKLANGGATGSSFVGASPSFLVTLENFDLIFTSVVPIYPDPVTTLETKKSYFVRAWLQRSKPGLGSWTTVAGSELDSSVAYPFHFTQAASGDADWNIRAIAANLQWTKTHLLETDQSDNSFEASIAVAFGRYDDWEDPVASVTTTLTLDFDLIEDSSGNQIPLENDGLVTSIWKPDSYATAGFDKIPVFISAGTSTTIRPLVQLESGSETYVLRCTIRHTEDGVGTEYVDATCDLAPTGLLHFNGNMEFGSILTTVDEFTSPPPYGTTGPNFVNTNFRIPPGAGSLPLNSQYAFGNNAILFGRLLDNGNAVVTLGSLPIYDPLAPFDPITHTTNCITYNYGSATLSSSGLTANSLTVGLPQGLIYLPDTTVASHHGTDTYVTAGTIALDGTVNLFGNHTFPLGANAGIVDESHPLQIGVGNVTFGPTGQISFGNITSHRYIHDAALTQLETDRAMGNIVPVDSEGRRLEERCSNDHYWRGINNIPAGDVTFTAAADKSARMTSEFDLSAQAFTTHFPQQADIDWQDNGSISMTEGVIQTTSSLDDIPVVDIPYHKTCEEDPCAKDVDKFEISFKPESQNLLLTPTGGLYRFGALNVPDPLEWGARGDGANGIDPNYPYAHRTDTFADGDFFMPGYQLYASANPLLTTAPYSSADGDHAPSALLLSGFGGDISNPEIHSPTESDYEAGNGHYPGLNFVVAAPTDVGASRLGGNQVDYPYNLLDGGSSKYYARCAGVFGRQVGVDGSFNPTLNIYDYDFELNSFQLSFKASEQFESWINGAVAVTGHSNFTQQFLGLDLNCLGELESATMDPSDNTNKYLVYWNSQFVPKSLRFEKEQTSAPGACPIEYTGYLTMGITTQVANIPTDLHGTFAFAAADGNLLTQTTGAGIGIDSELGLPGGVAISSPSKDYNLVPVGNLRFSNPNENPAAVEGQIGGWVTFGATIDVPYFEDFNVQVMTSANPLTDNLYLAPGWTENGKTFFSDKSFDPNHIGWPEGAIPISEYQLPNETTSDTYLIKAKQDLFGIVPLSYPMKWDSVTHHFESMTPNFKKLLVVEAFNQVDYLDADATKISFGAKYEGVPEINLANMLNSQIDQAAQAMSDAVSEPLKDALDQAFQEFEDFLADSLDAVIDPVVDEAAEQVICPLYDELKIHYDNARAAGDDWNQFKSDMDAEIAARIYDTGFPTAATELRDQLVKISQVTGDAASMTEDLKTAIEGIIIGIDVMVNEVQLSGSTPVFNIDPDAVVGGASGLLKKNLSGEREIIQNLIGLLLQNLVEPEVSAILTPLLNDLSSGLNSELNALLEEIDPVLDQIVDALNQVRAFLVEVHVIIDTASGFINDFDQLVNQAITSLDGFREIMAKPATRVLKFMEDLAKANGINIVAGTDLLNAQLDLFEEFDKDAFVLTIKTELKDAIMQSKLMEQFQFIVRQTLYDFQLKFEQTVSSVLSQVTDVMKEVISETIGALEDEINPLLGDVSSVMGAAEISGYAEINGDSLRKLRLDASMQLQIPDEMELNVFLEIISYTSEDATNGCVEAGEKAVEVTIGATDVPFDWISDGLRASLSVKMSLKDKGSGLRPNGVGGAFELTGGEISFETFKITCLAATVAIGEDDCYFGARACGEFNSYKVSIGVFFGKTCSKDPLVLVDADVADVLNGPYPLIGIYIYGEVCLPILELAFGIPASCLLDVSACIGAGVGFFLDPSYSPVFVGKMYAAVSGEALCVVSIKGEVTMVGLIQEGSFSASGTGKLSGKVGWCPFCIKFGASAKITYNNGDWGVDL